MTDTSCAQTFDLLLPGYGQTGPDAKRAGYDVIVAATGGLTHITGPEVIWFLLF
jgi:hypothetical protein